jgi:hypothetical protein
LDFVDFAGAFAFARLPDFAADFGFAEALAFALAFASGAFFIDRLLGPFGSGAGFATTTGS